VTWRGNCLELVLYVGEVEAEQSLNRKRLAAEELHCGVIFLIMASVEVKRWPLQSTETKAVSFVEW
jgi:hypothetical protein